MKSFKYFFGVVVVSLIPVGVVAEDLNCKFPNNSSGGFVPENILLSIDRKKRKIRVIDAFINHIEGKPRTLDADINASNVVRFKWELKNFPLHGGTKGKVRYRALYVTGQKALTITAVLAGYDNEIRGRGTCSPLK